MKMRTRFYLLVTALAMTVTASAQNKKPNVLVIWGDDIGTTPFHGEKNSNWEGAFRVPCFLRYPNVFPANVTLNGIVSHEDWLPTIPAIAGAPDIKEKLLAGVELNGRTYKNHIDGFDLTPYLTGETDASPRNKFLYTDDAGHIVAIRVGDWKAVYAENRAERLQIWKEPFVQLRAPDLYNLRRDPYEKAKLGSNTYEDWYIDRALALGPMQMVASQFLFTLKDFLPSQVPGDWSLDTLEKQIKSMTNAGQSNRADRPFIIDPHEFQNVPTMRKSITAILTATFALHFGGLVALELPTTGTLESPLGPLELKNGYPTVAIDRTWKPALISN